MSTRNRLREISASKAHLENRQKVKNLVSVCIPNYNKSDYIEECLQSIYDQTYEKIELIIVDDNSTDNSKNIINKFVKKNKKRFYSVETVFSPRRVGNAWATNMAYYLSDGEYIAQMDSDDVSHKDRISLQVKYIKKNNYDLVGTNFKTAYRLTNHITNDDGGYWLKYTEHEIADACAKEVHCVCFGTILFKHIVADEIGGLNRSLIGTEDWDFIDRVYRAGFRIGNLRDILYIYRLHPDQRSALYHKK